MYLILSNLTFKTQLTLPTNNNNKPPTQHNIILRIFYFHSIKMVDYENGCVWELFCNKCKGKNLNLEPFVYKYI